MYDPLGILPQKEEEIRGAEASQRYDPLGILPTENEMKGDVYDPLGIMTKDASKESMFPSDIEPLPESDVSSFGPRAVGAIAGGVKAFEGAGFGGIAGVLGGVGPIPEDPFAEPTRGSLEQGAANIEAMGGVASDIFLKTPAQQEGVQALMWPIEKLGEASRFVGDTVQKAATGVGGTTEDPFAEEREGEGIPELGATVATAFEGMVFFYGMPKAMKWAKEVAKIAEKKGADAVYVFLKDKKVQEANEAYQASKKGAPLTEPDRTPARSTIPGKPETELHPADVPIRLLKDIEPKVLRPDQVALLKGRTRKKPLPPTEPMPLLKPDTTPVKSERVLTVEERLGKRPVYEGKSDPARVIPEKPKETVFDVAEKAPDLKPKEPVAPDGKADSIDALIKEFEATGRVAARYPRKKTISLSGGRAMPEKEAVARMRDVVAKAKEPKKPAVKVEAQGIKDQRGSVIVPEEVVTKVVEAGEKVKDVTQKIGEALDIEHGFVKRNAPETGRHMKGIYSVKTLHQQQGLELIKGLVREGYTKEDLGKIPLYVENPLDFHKLPKPEQARMKGAVDKVDKYFKDSLEEYKKEGGLEGGFKENMLARLEQDLKNAKPGSEKSKAIQESIAALEKTEYVHIPYYAWFEHLRNIDPSRASKALKILAQQKRKTISIKGLVEEGVLKPEEVNLADIVGSYARRKGHDLAILRVLNSAQKEGMVIPKTKQQYAITKKGGKINPPIIGGVQYTEMPAYISPATAGKYVHPYLAEMLHQLTQTREGIPVLDPMLQVVKGAQFYNFGFLGMYNTVQGIMLDTLRFRQPIRSGKLLHGAFKDVLQKTPEYWEAADNYLFSKPFDIPWKNYDAMLKDAPNALGGEYFSMLDDILRLGEKKKLYTSWKGLNPLETLKEVYETSWNIAWMVGDEPLRMASYKSLKADGFSPAEAAQIAARGHADYASVPPKARRILNRVFFTPTFKITMGKFHKEMFIDTPAKLIKNTMKGEKMTPREKVMLKAAASTIGVLVGYDQMMTKVLGFERDQFARRYYREVETTDDNGKTVKKEVVVTFSNPANMFLKYAQRTWGSFTQKNENPWYSLWMQNKWEIHPVHRTLYDIIAYDEESAQKADKMGRDMIWHPADSQLTRRIKEVDYALKNFIAITKTMDEPLQDKKTKAVLDKEIGTVIRHMIQPFTFSYVRGTKEDRARYDVFKKTDLFRMIMKMKTTKPEHRAKMMQEVRDSIKKYKESK